MVLKAIAKERIEVYSNERVFVIDNWRKLTAFGVKGFSKLAGNMDKGQKKQFALLNDRMQNGANR